MSDGTEHEPSISDLLDRYDDLNLSDEQLDYSNAIEIVFGGSRKDVPSTQSHHHNRASGILAAGVQAVEKYRGVDFEDSTRMLAWAAHSHGVRLKNLNRLDGWFPPKAGAVSLAARVAAEWAIRDELLSDDVTQALCRAAISRIWTWSPQRERDVRTVMAARRHLDQIGLRNRPNRDAAAVFHAMSAYTTAGYTIAAHSKVAGAMLEPSQNLRRRVDGRLADAVLAAAAASGRKARYFADRYTDHR